MRGWWRSSNRSYNNGLNIPTYRRTSYRRRLGDMKSRLSKYRDRASYKSSEVVGLFVVSLFLGMLFFLICVAIDYAFQLVFGGTA